MKTVLIWLGALLALGVLNLAIRQKEATLAGGETVYLKLAPVDPRSLMQGDYMVLNYAIARELRQEKLDAFGGHVVIELDGRAAATFVRLDDGSALAANERTLTYKNRRGAQFGIESFFFQEGKGAAYADAEYAEIRLSPSGGAMLIGLVLAP
jgi:uncharacterized membrane-anchored protein